MQALGKLVGGAFQRGAVQAVVNVFRILPLGAIVVHGLHYLQRKGGGGRIGVALAGHILHALIQASIAKADGGVAAVQQLVNGLALLQAGQCTVLPQNGGGIAAGAL